MSLSTFNNGESNLSVRTKINAAIDAVNAMQPGGFTALSGATPTWNAGTESSKRSIVLDVDKTVTISSLTPDFAALLYVSGRVADTTLTINGTDITDRLHDTGNTLVGIVHVGGNVLMFDSNKLGATTTGGGGGVATDADAQNYITAEGITDATEIEAVDNLFIALKAGANSYAQIKGLYPFLGSGLRNAKTLTSFNLTTASGGTTPVFNAAGVTFDGVDDYLNTDIIPFDDFAVKESESFGVYVKTAVGGAVIGTKNSDASSYLFPVAGDFNSQGPGDFNIGATTDGTGRFIVSFNGAVKRVTKNGVQVYNNTSSSNPADRRITTPFWLGAFQNDGYATGGGYSACTLGLAFIGEGLTNTQMAEIDAAIAAFITTLSRA